MANDCHFSNHMEKNCLKTKLRIDKKEKMDGEESLGELDVLVLPLKP